MLESRRVLLGREGMQALGYRFSAVVCFCLLVGSVLFPFATSLAFISSHPPVPLPFNAVKETFWSFMSLREWLSQREDGYATVDKSWSIFSDYWSSTTRSVDRSSLLVLAFILQVVCLLLGIFVVVSERRIWKTILLLPLTVILDVLYLWMAQVFHAELCVGFWVSIVSTVFVLTLIPFNRSPRINHHESEKDTDKEDRAFQYELTKLQVLSVYVVAVVIGLLVMAYASERWVREMLLLVYGFMSAAIVILVLAAIVMAMKLARIRKKYVEG